MSQQPKDIDSLHVWAHIELLCTRGGPADNFTVNKTLLDTIKSFTNDMTGTSQGTKSIWVQSSYDASGSGPKDRAWPQRMPSGDIRAMAQGTLTSGNNGSTSTEYTTKPTYDGCTDDSMLPTESEFLKSNPWLDDSLALVKTGEQHRTEHGGRDGDGDSGQQTQNSRNYPSMNNGSTAHGA